MYIRYAVLSIAALLTLAFLPAEAEDTPPASVTGTVTLKGQPVQGVTIVFEGPDGQPVEAQTDDSGRFVLPPLPAGKSHLRIEFNGEPRMKNRGKVAEEPGEKAVKVNGVVTLDGKPIDEATVGFHPVSANGKPASAKTNEDGSYQLQIAPGTYKVTVAKGNLLPRYDDVLRTALQVDVKAGTNTFDLNLTSR